MAAQQGHAKAQHNLGLFYINGEGGPQDYMEAWKWLLNAAQQGLAKAQYNLGVFYVAGEGVPQNYATAYAWFDIAAAQGIEHAPKSRDLAATKLDPSSLAEARKLSKEYFKLYVKPFQ
jgi:TPR repeat protein